MKLPRTGRMNYLPKRTNNRNPTSDQDFYNSTAWRKVRLLKIQDQPFCEVHQHVGELIDCTFGQPIDHMVSIADNGARLSLANLMTLCETCHNRKSALEGKNGCLVKTFELEGELYPAKGEKERLIEMLAKYCA